MTDSATVLEQLSALRPELAGRYGVREIGLFGSVLRGEQTSESDVDVLVDFERPISLFRFAEMENFLADRLHEKVDLVMKSALKPAIGKQILQEVRYL
jgi:hypothetical protein